MLIDMSWLLVGGPRLVDITQVTMQLLSFDTDLSIPDDPKIDEFWKRVQTNLAAGRVRLVFVADELPTELRRIIEFLNQQMSPADVIGIELRNYEGGDGLRALVPRVVGLTEAAKEHKRVGQSGPTGEQLWADAEPEVQKVRSLVDYWAQQHGLEAKDLGKSRKYTLPGKSHALVFLYPGSKYRSIYFTLSELDSQDADKVRLALSVIAGKQITSKEPGLLCATAAENWQKVVDDVLQPLLDGASKV